MAFLEALSNRKVLQGSLPVDITLAGNVAAGDCLGYDSGWKLSASATTIMPVLVAGVDGKTGQVIKAFLTAIVQVVNVADNTPTLGDKVALTDGGLYQVADTELPDVGYVVGVPSTTVATLALFPMATQLTVVRS